MRGKWVIPLLLLGCQSDFIPEGLYDYQVERLLSSGNSKVWIQVTNADYCHDSTKLFIQLIANTLDDSVAISVLTPRLNCDEIDTLFVGNADASSFEESLLFTDTLNFSDGNFWLVHSISERQLQIDFSESIRNYRAQ